MAPNVRAVVVDRQVIQTGKSLGKKEMNSWSGPERHQVSYVWRICALICAFLDLILAFALLFCAIVWVTTTRLLKLSGIFDQACLGCDLQHHHHHNGHQQPAPLVLQKFNNSGDLPKKYRSGGSPNGVREDWADPSSTCACGLKRVPQSPLGRGCCNFACKTPRNATLIINEEEQVEAFKEGSDELLRQHHIRRLSQESFSWTGSMASPLAIGTELEEGSAGIEDEIELGGSALKEMEEESVASLYHELEEERNAASSAAQEALAMISRLQEDKAAIEMEARQYQRMAEEKYMYDQESLNGLQEMLNRSAEEVLALEEEVDLYRNRLLTLGMDALMYQNSGRDWLPPASPRIEELGAQGNFKEICGIVNKYQKGHRGLRSGDQLRQIWESTHKSFSSEEFDAVTATSEEAELSSPMGEEASHAGYSNEGGQAAEVERTESPKKMSVLDYVWKFEEQFQQLGSRKLNPPSGKLGLASAKSMPSMGK